jgi:ferritin
MRRALYDLVELGMVESTPPNKQKVCELFTLSAESIYLKLVLYEQSREALQFESELNRFAADNHLNVRMSQGKVLRNDLQTLLSPFELIDRYKLFIGIQNNKLSRMFEPHVFQGLMEGLYRNADPELQAMMRMYEFFEIDSLELLDMFEPRGVRAAPAPSRPIPAVPHARIA